MSAFQRPQWEKPAPLGYGHAADAAHFVAAPLLAAAGVAMIGVLGADGEKFRWPGAGLLFLSLAVLALVGSIQTGFHARALLYSAADLEAWWGREDLDRHQETLRDRQRAEFEEWTSKIHRAVTLYNLGIVLLGVGLCLCVVPLPGSDLSDAVPRWIAFVALASGAAAELVWAVMVRPGPRLFRRN